MIKNILICVALQLMAAGCAVDAAKPVADLGPTGRPATAVAWSPDGRFLAIGDSLGSIRVWQVAGWREVASSSGFRRPYSVGALGGIAFAPDSSSIAFAGENGNVCVQSLIPGHEPVVLTGHTHNVCEIVFSQDGNRIASVSGGIRSATDWKPFHSVLVHDVTTGHVESDISGLENVLQLRLVRCSERFVSTSSSARPPFVALHGQVEIRSLMDGTVAHRFPAALGVRGSQLFVSPDGTRFHTAGAVYRVADGSIVAEDVDGEVFDVDSDHLLYVETETQLRGSRKPVTTARFKRINILNRLIRAGPRVDEYSTFEGSAVEAYSPDRSLYVDRSMRVWSIRF